MIEYWHLFLAFFRANIVGFGGGPGSIPLIRQEVVDVYGWMTNEEFTQALAVGNSLPGPIATKLAAYVGYNVAGVPGAIVSLIAAIGPTAIMMIALFSIILKYKDNQQVKGMLTAIQPVVMILLLFVVYEIANTTYTGTSYMLFIVTIVAFVAIFILKIHPVFMIILAMIIGVVFSRFIS